MVSASYTSGMRNRLSSSLAVGHSTYNDAIGCDYTGVLVSYPTCPYAQCHSGGLHSMAQNRPPYRSNEICTMSYMHIDMYNAIKRLNQTSQSITGIWESLSEKSGIFPESTFRMSIPLIIPFVHSDKVHMWPIIMHCDETSQNITWQWRTSLGTERSQKEGNRCKSIHAGYTVDQIQRISITKFVIIFCHRSKVHTCTYLKIQKSTYSNEWIILLMLSLTSMSRDFICERFLVSLIWLVK